MIVYNNDYSNEQLNIISALSEKFGISFKLAKILFSRGINTEELRLPSGKRRVRFVHPLNVSLI